MNEQSPRPLGESLAAELRCVAATVGLLATSRMHLPKGYVGQRIAFADGTSSVVYRETVVDLALVEPAVLVVAFRLRRLRSPRAHALFRAESLLNTPLFVGFPGFASKLWMAHDQTGRYRGVYQWDGAARAESYARALWRVLAMVSVSGSIAFHVVPGLRREDLLRHISASAVGGSRDWWRPVELSVQKV